MHIIEIELTSPRTRKWTIKIKIETVKESSEEWGVQRVNRIKKSVVNLDFLTLSKYYTFSICLNHYADFIFILVSFIMEGSNVPGIFIQYYRDYQITSSICS